MLFGIDISGGMIKKARSKVYDEKMIFFQTADSENIPFKSESFDYVFSTNSFHHYHNPEEVLREIKRVLSRQGKFYILDIAKNNSFGVLFWNFIKSKIERGHNRYYSVEEFKTLLIESNFQDVELLYRENGIFKHGKLIFSIQIWKGVKG